MIIIASIIKISLSSIIIKSSLSSALSNDYNYQRYHHSYQHVSKQTEIIESLTVDDGRKGDGPSASPSHTPTLSSVPPMRACALPYMSVATAGGWPWRRLEVLTTFIGKESVGGPYHLKWLPHAHEARQNIATFTTSCLMLAFTRSLLHLFVLWTRRFLTQSFTL